MREKHISQCLDQQNGRERKKENKDKYLKKIKRLNFVWIDKLRLEGKKKLFDKFYYIKKREKKIYNNIIYNYVFILK